MKSFIEPGDWYLVRIDGWPLFSKQKPVHWHEGEGNNTRVFWCFCCHCCDYTCVSVLIALKWHDCVSTHQVTLQVCALQVLWPGTNSCHWTWWVLLAPNPGQPREREPYQVAVLPALAGSSLHSDYHQWQYSSTPNLSHLRCPHLKLTCNLWRGAWVILVGGRMPRNKDRWCTQQKILCLITITLYLKITQD